MTDNVTKLYYCKSELTSNMYSKYQHVNSAHTSSSAQVHTVPPPIAIPTSAIASAGLSLIPSPTMHTDVFCSCVGSALLLSDMLMVVIFEVCDCGDCNSAILSALLPGSTYCCDMTEIYQYTRAVR